MSAVGLTSTQVETQGADGDLDPTFGNGGKVIVGLNSSPNGPSLAIQADGRMVVASSPYFQPALTLTRFFSDGSFDPTFATVPVPNLQQADLAIQSDGKIVVVTREGVVVRFNPNGSIDTTFGNQGRVELYRFQGHAIAIQSDGRLVVVGAHRSEFDPNPDDSYDHYEIEVRRLGVDGAYDAAFADVLTDLGWNLAMAFDVVIQPNGRIIVVGVVWDEIGGAEFALLRLTTIGGLDTAFGNGGVVLSHLGGSFQEAPAVALQSDGRIVVTGPYSNAAGGDFVLARYRADGSVDAGFGSGGTVIARFADTHGRVRALAIQHDGKILLAGGVYGGGAFTQYGLMRFTTAGARDWAFGNFGVVRTSTAAGDPNQIADDMVIQPDGAVMVAGRTSLNGVLKTALVRYQGPSPTAPKTLTFFLRGEDTGFTMTETAPASHVESLFGETTTWISEPTLNGTLLGTFPAGASVTLVLPCLPGQKTIELATESADGGDEQLLGQVAAVPSPRCKQETIAIPVPANTTLTNRRLRLTISAQPVPFNLPLGGTFLRVENFAAAP